MSYARRTCGRIFSHVTTDVISADVIFRRDATFPDEASGSMHQQVTQRLPLHVQAEEFARQHTMQPNNTQMKLET